MTNDDTTSPAEPAPGHAATVTPPQAPPQPPKPPGDDSVDEAGEESFPASDPPAWTGTTA